LVRACRTCSYARAGHSVESSRPLPLPLLLLLLLLKPHHFNGEQLREDVTGLSGSVPHLHRSAVRSARSSLQCDTWTIR